MQIARLSLLAAMVSAATLAHAEDQAGTANDHSDMEWVSVKGALFGQQVSDSVKTPTLLLDVPQSVSIISAEEISAQALFSVADVMQYTPGVSIGLGEDHRDQVTIRGQNTTADFFVDGLRDDVQYFRPLYNVERVEVLRGANALLFGRGGGGGIVNRVTKTADTSANSTSISASADSFSATSVSVDSNTVINQDHAFRLNAVVDTVDNHRDYKDGDRYAINPTYTWVAGDNTLVNASYEYVDDDRLVDRGVPALNNRPLEGFDETYLGNPDFNRTTFEGHIARVRVEQRWTDQWTSNATVQFADYDKFYQNLYPVGFDDQAGTVTLDGYADATERENTLFQVNTVGQFDLGGLAHTVLTGVEYGQQDTENARRDNVFADNGDDQLSFAFSDPLAIPSHSLAVEPARDRASEVTFYSAFIQDEIELTENWILVAGLRYDRFEIDVVNNDSGTPIFVDASDSEVSPRAGVIYKPSKDVSIYASYSKSFLPRSGDQFLTLSLSAAALDPEEFENQEVGVKWNITDGLSLTAAYFEVERDSGTSVDPSDPERSILIGTETDGFELQLTGLVTDNWTINAGYSNLQGERIQDETDLAQLPEHMVTVWNMVDLNDQWRLGGGIIYQSEQYASLNNTTELPDFTRVDAALYYQATDALAVQLNVENLLDEDYYPSAHNDNNISTGEPLNARLGFTYSF